jgi:adenylate kinase
MKLILLGIQGAGKSTQGNLLKKKLGIHYLSTGHIFRDLAKEHTPQGRKIKETMNAGYLIPDSHTLKIVSEYLKRPEYQKGYILDGFPRTIKQAETFENGIDKVIYLNVSDREALWRLSFRNHDDGREDESLAAIRKRIMLYHKHTDPVLDHYKKHHKLIEVNGEQKIQDIHKEIIEKLGLKNHKK